MPRNGSGTFSVSNTFTANTNAQSSEVNANFSDVGSEITNSLPRDGQAGMTGQLKASSGTVAVPGVSFVSDTNSGFYRKAGDTIGVSCGGADAGVFSASGFAASTVVSDDVRNTSGDGYAAFASGTKMLFGNATAPTGWTRDTVTDNAALRLGSAAAGGTGGTADFTDVMAARTVAKENLPNYNLDKTLSVSLTGTTTNVRRGGGETGIALGGGGSVVPDVLNSSATTNLGVTLSGNVQLGGSGTAMDFAVKYVDVNLCTKD